MGEDRQPYRRRSQRFMTNLVDEVKSCLRPGSFARRCRRNGCSVILDGAPVPNCLIDMDTGLVGKNDSKCDYIFIGGTDNAWVVPIELKKGAFNFSQVVKQLRAGAQFAETICEGFQVRFRPVVASGAVNQKKSRRDLRNKSTLIRFRGRNMSFERIRCGDSLTSVLK